MPMPEMAWMDEEVRTRAADAARHLLEERWASYLALVAQAEEMPGNRDGADKSRILPAWLAFHAHVRSVKGPR